FVGHIEQVPPAFSALKVSGERSHELAREGKDVQLAARTIRIDAIRVTGYEWPFLDVEIDCGKGTYIRSIARDLGAKLDCGGLVQTLRRTRVGPFTAEQGIGLDADPAVLKLLPMSLAVSGLPQLRASAEDAKRLLCGQPVRGRIPGEEEVAVLDESGELVAIGAAKGGSVWPKLVLTKHGEPGA